MAIALFFLRNIDTSRHKSNLLISAFSDFTKRTAFLVSVEGIGVKTERASNA